MSAFEKHIMNYLLGMWKPAGRKEKCKICKQTTFSYLFKLNGDLNRGLGLYPEQSTRFYAFQILDASFEVLNSSVAILLDCGTQCQA